MLVVCEGLLFIVFLGVYRVRLGQQITREVLF